MFRVSKLRQVSKTPSSVSALNSFNELKLCVRFVRAIILSAQSSARLARRLKSPSEIPKPISVIFIVFTSPIFSCPYNIPEIH